MDNRIIVKIKKTGEIKRVYYRWAAQMISRGEASFFVRTKGAPPSNKKEVNLDKKPKKKKKSVPKKSKKQD